MKTYKINNVEVSEDDIREIIKNNPELKDNITKRWRSVNSGLYNFVRDDGIVILRIENCNVNDDFKWNTGNYFKTPEEAQKYKEKLLATQRIKDAISKINKGWTPDWKNENQRKYYLSMNSNDREFWLYYAFRWQHFPSSFYIKDEESAEIIMRKCREDYRIMLDIE